MAPWNRLPKETADRIEAEYRAGEKTDLISLRHNVSRTAPRKIAARRGLPPRPLYSRQPMARHA